MTLRKICEWGGLLWFSRMFGVEWEKCVLIKSECANSGVAVKTITTTPITSPVVVYKKCRKEK